jgi:cell division protein FtsQ
MALGLVAGIALMGWMLFYSTVFSAREVTVVGAEQVTSDQVRAAAAVPRDSALARLPLAEIAHRVELLDSVASAKVVRDWPDTVRIVLTERRPVAVLRSAGEFALVGSDAVVNRTEPHRPDGLPILDRLSGSVGSAPIQAASGAAFGVAAALPEDLSRKVDRIAARSAHSVRLILRNGARVEWGSPVQNQRKATVLMLLLDKQAQRYDVSTPDAPAWFG